MRDEWHDGFLFWFCGVGGKKLSADRDEEPALGILCFRGVCDNFFSQDRDGKRIFSD